MTGLLKRLTIMSFLTIGALVGFAQDKPAATQPSRQGLDVGGEWISDVLEQKSTATPAMLLFGDKAWKDYTLELDAQKTGGDEGFLIAFRAKDAHDYAWLNVGGWGNSRTGFELISADGNSDLAESQTAGDFQPVDLNTWHHIKLVVAGNKAEAFVDGKSASKLDAATFPEGCIGLGTWATQARFRNIKVTAPDGKVLWQGLPATGVRISGGEWKNGKDEIAQTNSDSPALLMFGEKSWKDYTLELEGQKTGGDEGFLIAVRVNDPANLVWLNVGGWGNTRTAFEFAHGDDGKTDLGDNQTYGDFQEVKTDQWTKLKIVVSGNKVEGFVNGKSACKFDAATLPQGGVALGTWSTQAKFRNVKVTAPDGKVLWEGVPKVN